EHSAGDVRCLRELGGVCLALGHGDEAVSVATRAVTLTPDDPEMLGNLAISFLIAGQLPQAETAIQAALRAAPGDQVNRNVEGLIRAVRVGERERPRDLGEAMRDSHLEEGRDLLLEHDRAAFEGDPANADRALDLGDGVGVVEDVLPVDGRAGEILRHGGSSGTSPRTQAIPGREQELSTACGARAGSPAAGLQDAAVPIPDFQSCFLPILSVLSTRGPTPMREVVEAVSDHFKLSEAERRELLPSGQQEIVTNRVGWARTYLKKAGLVDSPKKGIAVATTEGKRVLGLAPQPLNVRYLKDHYPQFAAFHTQAKPVSADTSRSNHSAAADAEDALTPEEQVE
nr:hypothetical protein [Planctomycetota bacterium]